MRRDRNIHKMSSAFKCLALFVFIIIIFPLDQCKQNITDEFIIEYFRYRAPSTVVGFTCDQYENDVQLIKKFSDVKLQSLIWKLENRMELSSLAKALHHRLGVFIDLRCQFSENVKMAFNEATDHKMFDELYYWLILGSDLNESLSLINDNSFGVSTDFVLAIFEENQCILYDIYNPCKLRGGTLKTTRLGFWNESSGLNIVFELNKVRRWNLEGMAIRISGLVCKRCSLPFKKVETCPVVKNRPSNVPVLEYLQDPNYKHLDRLTRLGYAMWMHLADMFNFTVQIVFLKHITRFVHVYSLEFNETTVWNEGDENGPVMTSLMNGEIDASGTADALTIERLDLVKAVYPALPFRYFIIQYEMIIAKLLLKLTILLDFRTCFIFRSTSSDRISVRDIFLPLSSTVWYLTIAISVLSINALAFLSILSNRDIYENYLSSIIIHVGAFCQQGTEFSSNNLSGRIAILHILLFNLLLYNYYLASAVSNRLSEPITLINDSLHELRKTDFQYASEPMLDFDRHIKVDAAF
ncbi:hypothetical protein TSAR_009460 [Trichomalopsis sarcophagae]|uniref:Ionotropic receptor 75a N-terminal domain-containing protein n=1 Tax=Trichomalopsis sarcophagae TaxID=543379 RepID=A0A232FM93_9HYME|nr:hypothetical protein TSAR_009460 [Trichomalopsis sarcophagae]